MATSTPDDRRRVKLPRSLPDRSRTAAVLPGGRALFPQPRLLRPRRRARGARRRAGRRARPPRLVDPDPPRSAVHRDRELAVVPRRRPHRSPRRDRRREGTAARRHLRDTSSSTPTPARSARRTRTAAGARPMRARASCDEFSRLTGVGVPTLVARIRRSVLRSPFAPAVVVSHPNGGLVDYLAERAVELSRLQVDGAARAHVPAGRARRGVPRPARRGQPERSSAPRDTRARSRVRSSASRESRRRTTRCSTPASSPRTCASTRSGGSPVRSSMRTDKLAADAAADDRRARSSAPPRRRCRTGSRSPQANGHGDPTGGRRRRDEPAHRRRSTRSRAIRTYNQVRRGERPRVPRNALYHRRARTRR